MTSQEKNQYPKLNETRQRSSVVCIHERSLLTVKLQDPVDRHTRYYIPGGAIDPGETPVAAAARETKEETSYSVSIQEQTETILTYDFVWNGSIVPCKTYFYIGDLVSFHPIVEVEDASYHRGVEWMPLDQWYDLFAYHDAIRQTIRNLIEN